MGWLKEHFAPVRAAVRSVGLRRALPVSLILGTVVLVLGILEQIPATHDLVHQLTHYRGNDLRDGRFWRLLLSPFGSMHRPHVLWTIGNIVLVVAPLEARIRPLRTFLLLAASQFLPSLWAFAVLMALGNESGLARLDYGTSASAMCAAAALAVLRRSWLIGGYLSVVLVVDLVYSDPLTISEHWAAAGIGVIGGLLFTRRG